MLCYLQEIILMGCSQDYCTACGTRVFPPYIRHETLLPKILMRLGLPNCVIKLIEDYVWFNECCYKYIGKHGTASWERCDVYIIDTANQLKSKEYFALNRHYIKIKPKEDNTARKKKIFL